jgi:hypothetical protein
VKRLLLWASAAYLVLGLVFGLSTMPQQTYVCAAPQEPHGEITYGGLDGPPRDDCRPTVTTADRVQWVGLATVLWMPLAALKGYSNMQESRQHGDLQGGLAPLP